MMTSAPCTVPSSEMFTALPLSSILHKAAVHCIVPFTNRLPFVRMLHSGHVSVTLFSMITSPSAIMSAEMFCEVRNVTAESDSGKERRRMSRKEIALDDHLSLSPKRAQPKKTTADEFRAGEQCDTLTRTLLLTMSNVPHALMFKSFREVLEVDLRRRDIALICVV